MHYNYRAASREPGATWAKWREKCERWGTQGDEIQRMMGHILKTFPDPIKSGLDAATTVTIWLKMKNSSRLAPFMACNGSGKMDVQ